MKRSGTNRPVNPTSSASQIPVDDKPMPEITLAASKRHARHEGCSPKPIAYEAISGTATLSNTDLPWYMRGKA